MSEPKVDKRRLIKDPVWGNLELFSWEGRLVNHFLFNRLHNIVQNSSAYKVYPGLKYSRFLHTVGVSHVATQLFLSSAARAEGGAQESMAKDATRVGEHFSEESKNRVINAINRSYPCPPHHALILAAVRIAALLHDIGHLPFSHVFENALDGFRQGELGDAIKLSSAGRAKRDELNGLLAGHDNQDSDTRLHELLGKTFTDVLQTTFRHEPELFGLLKAASVILQTDQLPTLKGFIIGTIDADRIDFVRRDGFFSGLFNSSVDFGRLFAFYELAEDKETGNWLPRPSTRASSETEKLLLERFQDYKYIVVHHRVHLYDEIMENILVRLMANGTLARFVDTLCGLLRFAPDDRTRLNEQQDRIELLRSLLTEFDDPWVEVIIRGEYAKIRKSEDKATKLLFEAYVEDRQCFGSAFKTDEEFQSACKKYAPELSRQDPNAVRGAFGATKYILQKDLGDLLDRTVLIGATDKKLSYGIRNDGAAKFFGVSDLRDFLVQKKIRSLTFNFWYEKRAPEPDSEAEREQIIALALPHLEKIVTKQFSLDYT